MLVLLEVLGQISDTLGQQSNLDLRGAGVTLVGSLSLDDFLLFLSRKCHGILLILLRGAAGPIPARSLSAGETRQGEIIHEGQTKSNPQQMADQTTFSRPPNNTTASAMISIAKNSRNDAQLRVSTLNFDSFLMHTSNPTQSTA